MGQIIRLPSGRHVLDTGKVSIGILAKPPVRDMGSQAELIQAALLDRPTHKGWPDTRSHIKGAGGAMDLRRLADAPTLRARDAYDEACVRMIAESFASLPLRVYRKGHAVDVEEARRDEPVLYLDNGLCARFMRGFDWLLSKVWR